MCIVLQSTHTAISIAEQLKMQNYIRISVLLCIYGVFKEFRPAEPYIVPYMTGPPLNFTSEEINHDIFPISTYSTMASLIVIFLLTDYLRYKVIIIMQAVTMIVALNFLIFGRGLLQMQVEEMFYGLHMAGEVAYFTYIYAKVDQTYFQEVTSHARSAYLVGKCLCGIVAQGIVSYQLCSYQGLLWITIASQVAALIWAITLPSVDKSIYFHRNVSEECSTDMENMTIKRSSNDCQTVMSYLWKDFVTAFTNVYVLKWTLWWALATCTFYMAGAYCQVLWQVIRTESHATNVQYNGIVETFYTLLGAVGSMIVGQLKVDWKRLGELLLAICSLVLGALLYTMSQTGSEIIAYVSYTVFSIIFQTMITVANSEVAKNINRDSYGLVFGITTFVVYVARSLFTYIALQVYRLQIRLQFEVYAVYFGVLGGFFILVTIQKWIKTK